MWLIASRNQAEQSVLNSKQHITPSKALCLQAGPTNVEEEICHVNYFYLSSETNI